MKKVILAFSLISVLLLSACASSKLSDKFDEAAVITRAKEVAEVILTRDYEAVNAQAREDVQGQLKAEDLKAALEPTLTKAGAFKEYKSIVTMGQKSKTTGDDYAVCVLTATCEGDTLTFTISMDTDLEIVGMYLK